MGLGVCMSFWSTTRRMSRDSKGHSRRARPVLSESDLRLWQEVTRNATPLPGRPVQSRADATSPGPETGGSKPVVASPPVGVPGPSSARPAALAPHQESDRERDRERGAGAGIDRRTHDRFRRGRMAIEGRLDLHGMTRERAHQALSLFLHRGHERGARCLLVVTGKGRGRDGGGVLRRDVPIWLGQGGLKGLVLAVSPARPHDGGDGALYILLRRRRDRAEGRGCRPVGKS